MFAKNEDVRTTPLWCTSVAFEWQNGNREMTYLRLPFRVCGTACVCVCVYVCTVPPIGGGQVSYYRNSTNVSAPWCWSWFDDLTLVPLGLVLVQIYGSSFDCAAGCACGWSAHRAAHRAAHVGLGLIPTAILYGGLGITTNQHLHDITEGPSHLRRTIDCTSTATTDRPNIVVLTRLF